MNQAREFANPRNWDWSVLLLAAGLAFTLYWIGARIPGKGNELHSALELTLVYLATTLPFALILLFLQFLASRELRGRKARLALATNLLALSTVLSILACAAGPVRSKVKENLALEPCPAEGADRRHYRCYNDLSAANKEVVKASYAALLRAQAALDHEKVGEHARAILSLVDNYRDTRSHEALVMKIARQREDDLVRIGPEQPLLTELYSACHQKQDREACLAYGISAWNTRHWERASDQGQSREQALLAVKEACHLGSRFACGLADPEEENAVLQPRAPASEQESGKR